MRGLLEVHAIGRVAASTSSLKLKPVPALDMMRYQRLSPDCLPLTNGGGSGGVARKPAARSFRDDEGPAVATDGSRLASYLAASQVDSKPARPRAPQPPSSSAARSPARDHGHHHPSDSSDTASPSSTGAGTGAVGGDVLLQWGHNKRSRCRRDSSAASSSASPSTQRRQTPGSGKIQRRASAEKLMMPPPPPATITRGSNLRSSSSFPPRAAGADASHSRSVEERSGGLHKRSSPDKPHNNKNNASTVEHHHMDSKNAHHHHHQHHHNNNGNNDSVAANGAAAAGEKLGGFELPRIFVSLSRKEKEDDFLVMKGTKLPQRPKKRVKNVDKSLQFVFPGMWLSDLTKGRYEVREKKCVKKRRRGLKGMESMESDSE